MVVAKIDMPGTEKGVDLDFDKPAPLDWKDYSSRLTSRGVAIRKGDTAQVTKVVVKGQQRISTEWRRVWNGRGEHEDEGRAEEGEQVELREGSGKADFEDPRSRAEADASGQSGQGSSPTGARGYGQRGRCAGCDASRRPRSQGSRGDSARVVNEKGLADKRRHGGSRFNLRFKGSVPGDDKSPDGVMKLLADYVEFKSN
jgi:hypothetical protein